MAPAKASTRYIGYLGGAAVAAGVGAAIAVAGAATANAETESDAPKTEAPKTEAPKTESGVERAKPLARLTDRIEKVTSQVTKAATAAKTKPSNDVDDSDSKLSDAGISATQITVRKPTAQEFEAKQVERLKGLFQGGAPAPSAAAAESDVTTAADESGIPNPFRADDPEPVDVPPVVVGVRDALIGAAPDAFDPYVREGVEQGYRVSQMIPWVNAVVPVTKIVPLIGPAVGGDLDARQVIVNELIKTTPPGSFLYYGYDLVADLANQEEAAADLKEQAFTTVWDLLDFGNFLHRDGQSGIGNAL